MEDSSVICVSFTDSPVIEQEQTHIKTEAGEEIHITCTVEAYPPPTVDWYRDDSLLSINNRGVVINQAANRYNLIILGNSHIISSSSLSHHHSPLIYTIISDLFLSHSIQKLNECLRVHCGAQSLQSAKRKIIFQKLKYLTMLTGQWSGQWSGPSQSEQFVQHLTCSD